MIARGQKMESNFTQGTLDTTNDLTLERRFHPYPHLVSTSSLRDSLVEDGLPGGEFSSLERSAFSPVCRQRLSVPINPETLATILRIVHPT